MQRRSFMAGLGGFFSAALAGRLLSTDYLEAASDGWLWGASATASISNTAITAAAISARLNALIWKKILDRDVLINGWQNRRYGALDQTPLVTYREVYQGPLLTKPVYDTYADTLVLSDTERAMTLNDLTDRVLTDAADRAAASILRPDSKLILTIDPIEPSGTNALEGWSGGGWAPTVFKPIKVKVNGIEREIQPDEDMARLVNLGGEVLYRQEIGLVHSGGRPTVHVVEEKLSDSDKVVFSIRSEFIDDSRNSEYRRQSEYAGSKSLLTGQKWHTLGGTDWADNRIQSDRINCADVLAQLYETGRELSA